MYPGMVAAKADPMTQAQNQSIPDFVRGYKYYSTHIKQNKCMMQNIFKPHDEKY
jgi:hypothetical protein